MATCPHCQREVDEARFCPHDGTPLAHLGAAPVGRELTYGDIVDGRYRIEAEVGRGGIGIVYLATSPALGDVAIKVLQRDTATRQTTVSRFAREARLSSRFDHPHIVRIHEFGYDAAGFYFLVMELLAGRSLFQVLQTDGRLAPGRALRILTQIASGLARAHELGVVHRDLKAENVMIRYQDGEHVTLMDFGLSRAERGGGAMMTAEGQLVGTPAYMAPEQWRGESVDARTDVYAFGVLAYEVLAGQPPFAGPNVVELMRAHVHRAPESLGDQATLGPLPPGLVDLVHRCLLKSAVDRPADMRAVHAELLAIQRALYRMMDDDTVGQAAALSAAPAQADLSILGQAELRAEIERLARLRSERLLALVRVVHSTGAPPEVTATADAIAQLAASMTDLGAQLSRARSALDQASQQRRSKEATLRGDLADASLFEAGLLDRDTPSVPRSRAEKNLATHLRESDPTLDDAALRLESLRARFDATDNELRARTRELETMLRRVAPPAGLPHPLSTLDRLDEALEAHRARLSEVRALETRG